MILECDIGNTCCKWRLSCDDGSGVKGGTFFHSEGFAALPALAGISRVKVACVANAKVRRQFTDLFENLSIQPEFASSAAKVVAVVNNDYDPASLGVDRWLAAVAGYMRYQRAVLIIDVGSALNIELVSGQGHYLGGYILPGAKLMRGALLSDTGQVRFGSDNCSSGLDFGCSTAGSVTGGVNAALVGASLVAIEQAKIRLPAGFAILLSGGGAESIKEYLPDSAEVVPDLVLDGLAWVLP